MAVGGVSAYSTLGTSDDPVLSSMLRWDDVQLVVTLFHELAHQVLYIKGDSAFNESFATAVEEIGIERWLQSRGEQDLMTAYLERRRLRRTLMELVAATRAELAVLYAEAVPDDEKRIEKAQRLDALSAAIGEELEDAGREASSWLGSKLNNARLASTTLYLGRVPAFRELFARCDNDIECFYARSKALAGLQVDARNRELETLAGGESLNGGNRLDVQ